MSGPDIQIVEGANDLQTRQHAKNTVIFAARRLRVQMAADIDGQGLGVRAVAAGEHVAHLVKPHAETCGFTPLLKQRTSLGILVGQRLTVVAARHARADPRHLHDTVPQPIAIHCQIPC